MSRKKRAINPPLNIYKKIALSFIILTLLLIAVIFYFTLSYAYITIYPAEQEVKTDFNFVIVEDAELVDAKEGIFIGQIVNETLEGEKTFTTTGTKQVFEDVVGEVKIINNLSRDQILVATTRLLTPDGILFRLQNRVNVPGRGSLIAEVYADDPSKPLAKAGTKFTIPGLSQSLQELVYAETDKDFKAEGVTVKAISQAEVDQAIESLAKDLAQQVFKEENVSKTKILTKEIIEQAESLDLLVDYKDLGHKLEYVGKEDLEGTEVYKLKLTRKNGKEMLFYLDCETGIQLKSSSYRKREETENLVETVMGDYNEVDGIMMPFQIETKVDGN